MSISRCQQFVLGGVVSNILVTGNRISHCLCGRNISVQMLFSHLFQSFQNDKYFASTQDIGWWMSDEPLSDVRRPSTQLVCKSYGREESGACVLKTGQRKHDTTKLEKTQNFVPDTQRSPLRVSSHRLNEGRSVMGKEFVLNSYSWATTDVCLAFNTTSMHFSHQ